MSNPIRSLDLQVEHLSSTGCPRVLAVDIGDNMGRVGGREGKHYPENVARAATGLTALQSAPCHFSADLPSMVAQQPETAQQSAPSALITSKTEGRPPHAKTHRRTHFALFTTSHNPTTCSAHAQHTHFILFTTRHNMIAYPSRADHSEFVYCLHPQPTY